MGHGLFTGDANHASPTLKETTMTLKTMLTAAAVSASVFAPAMQPANAQSAAPSVQRIADELELMRIPTEIEIAVDRKDWPKARSYSQPTSPPMV
jgi:hypothetical protein